MNDTPLILIVDDDTSVRKSLDRYLRANGDMVLVHAAAEECLADPQTRDAACLVIDLRLKGTSGLDLLDQLRAEGLAAPAIFITADDVTNKDLRRMEAFGAALFRKPFDTGQLREAILAAMGRS